MGAKLQYAKVIDKERFLTKGGRIHPGLENHVVLLDEPGKAAVFVVMRGWGEDEGAFTEQWRIVSPGGAVLYESAPRELHLVTRRHTESLEDEIVDLDVQFAADDYLLVFLLDEMEVARVQFPIVFEDDGEG